jgi:hypothetical protein
MDASPLASAPAAAPLAPAPSPLDDSGARMKAFTDKIDATTAEHDKSVDKDRAENQRIESDFFSKNPAPVFKPPAPYVPPKSSGPIEEWGSLAMMFAMLASHFTRTPLMTAMNAGAAVMQAFKQKDTAAATAAYQQWKDANEQTQKLYEYQRDAYKDLLSSVKDRMKNNVDLTKEETADYRARISAMATAFKDQTSLEMMQQNGVLGWAKLQDQRDKNMADLNIKQEKLDAEMAKIQGAVDGAKAEGEAKKTPEYQAALAAGDTMGVYKLLAEANPDKYLEKYQAEKDKQEKEQDSFTGQAKAQYDAWAASPEGQASSPDDRMKKEAAIYGAFKSQGGARLLPPLTDANKHWQAQALAAYQMPAPGQLQIAREPGWDGPDGALEEAKKLNPDFNPAKFAAVQAARKKLTSGKDSDAIASYVRLDQHLDFFKGLVDKLSDGADIKTLNSLAAAWGKQTGNPNVTSYETALSLVGDEIVKAATGAGVAGALGDREEIKKNFDPSLTKDQLRANINAVQVLVGGAMTSTINKYRNLLSPQEVTDAIGSREVMEHFHVDPDTARPRVEGAYDFGGQKYKVGPNGVEGGAAPAGPAGSGFKAQWTDKDGKPFGVVNGKYVYEDGTPVQ